MSEEDKKIVIVIGAGASADFYPQNFRFPVGEALIKMICDKEKIASFFWNEICESFRSIVFKKINTTDQSIINFHNSFCDFLGDKNFPKNMIELNFFAKSFISYLRKEVDALKNQISFCYFENNVHKKNVEEKLFEFYKDINANDEDLCDNEKNDKKECKFYKIIIANCNSRHIQISRLVNYYQPFSIDELLDSIKTEKIDVFEPLKIKKEDLKAILKSDENDFEKLEKQFRNELINAGKTLIALFLLRSEKRELFDNQNPENVSKIWYRHIRNLIINSGKNAEKIKEQIQNLTIISFNYDRSLDYYLRTRLKQDYYDEIKKKIFYPYGKLAEEEWDLNDYGSFERDGFNPYNEDELNKIRRLGQGLRVIGELDEEVVIKEEFDEETKKNLERFKILKEEEVIKFSKLISRKFYFKQVKEVLEKDYIEKLEEINKYLNENSKKEILEYHQKDCEFLLKRVRAILSLSLKDSKIYFLGFAFHQSNCDFLALNQLSKFSVEKKIYYTNFDESESINNAVKEIFYIPSDRFITIHESKKKGVYDALMHDFKLGF